MTVALLSLAAAALGRLPDRALHRVAHLIGVALYHLDSRRRALVRSNLRRVCAAIVATGCPEARVGEAARDDRALERLVRSAFGHYVRYYLEMLVTPSLTPDYFHERVRVDTPEVLDRAFADRAERGLILVGLHFGAIEMPGMYVVQRAGVPVTAPMESVADPRLQSYLQRSRAATGVRIIPLRDARRELREAVRRKEVAGLVADRDVLGNGYAVSLFGSPTRVPPGAALLAIDTGAPVYVAAVHRIGWGEYAGSAIALSDPPPGSLRQRVQDLLDQQARAFEQLIAVAPEQWWTLFFPIWTDQDAPEGRSRVGGSR